MPFLLIECDDEFAQNAEANESINVMGQYTSVKLVKTEWTERSYAEYKAWFNKGELADDSDWAAEEESEMALEIKLALDHPDEVSGTYIFNDGTKVYWSEGYSDILVVQTNGTRWTERDPYAPKTDYTRMAASYGEEYEAEEQREMTREEVIEFEVEKNGFSAEQAAADYDELYAE